MSDHGSVTGWIHDLKAGEEGQKQQLLWNRYFEQLIVLARGRLSPRTRSVEDEEDAVLSAFDSFFGRVKAGQFPELKDRTELWPLLVNITLCKTQNIHRRQHAKKRDVGRNLNTTCSEKDFNWFDQLADESPSPDLAVQAAEEASRLIEALEKESLQFVAKLKLEGYTNAQIGKKAGVMERSIERRLALIRQIWTEQIDRERT